MWVSDWMIVSKWDKAARERSNLRGQFPRNWKANIILKRPRQSTRVTFSTKKTLKSLMIPGGALLLFSVALAYSGWLALPVSALAFLSYCGSLAGMVLSWRFHSSRIFCCLFLLLLVHEALPALYPTPHLHSAGTLTAFRAVSLLLPLNYVLIALMEEQGLTLASFVPVGVFWFVQSVVVGVLWKSSESGSSGTLGLRHSTAIVLFPNYIQFVFLAAGLALAGRFALIRKTVDSSFLWSLGAVYLSIRSVSSAAASEFYFATAVGILVFSVIENSYSLAYQDELTSLPSRRAFNNATLQLRAPYCLAVVDIDHFKRFNDTYGHDVGDQVLRLVAAKLAAVTGGGQAYRCGGEEFTILFRGRTLPEVSEHLERLRCNVESAEFRMRGEDRRKMPRGPDRRKERPTRARKRKKRDELLHFPDESQVQALSVTVSIGVSGCESDDPKTEVIMEAADKALYRAKQNGRNRVEVASPKTGRRAKAAGIA